MRSAIVRALIRAPRSRTCARTHAPRRGVDIWVHGFYPEALRSTFWVKASENSPLASFR